MRTPFLGSAYRSRSKNLADQRCINLYPELVETRTSKDIGAFYMTPGLRLMVALAIGPVRGFHITAGQLFAVSGNSVYAISNGFVAILLGTIGTSTGPVTIIDNGIQTAIFDGQAGYLIGPSTAVSGVVVDTPGTGYAPGDSITIAGGRFSSPAVLHVATTKIVPLGAGGAVVSVQILNPGTGFAAGSTVRNVNSYSIGTDAAASGGAVFTVSSSTGGGIDSVVIQQGGHDFNVGDVLVLQVPAAQGNGATVQVVATQTASGGVASITSASLTTPGTGFPSKFLVVVPATGGTGTGAQFAVGSSAGGGADSLSVVGGGEGYTVGDVLTLTTPGVIAGVTVTVISVSTGDGSGGTPGPVVLTGTTGTGTKFQINGTIGAGGTLESFGGIVDPGSYTVNPTNLDAEPVTGGGLVGATISILMGIQSVSIANGGDYITNPTNPVSQSSTSGTGANATFDLIFSPLSAQDLSVIDLPFTGPVSASYQDGFGIVNQSGTDIWWQSNLFDLSTWDPLNFSSADGKPDDIIATADIRREVWLIKQNETEVWINAGLNGFAFQRLDGVFIQVGTVAAASVARSGESLFWLSHNKQGQGLVVMSRGYNVSPVSTHAIDFAIEQYPTISDAVAYTYQQQGHSFYVINFPSGNATWVYDITASELAGVPLWHQRAAFSNGLFARHWGQCQVNFNGQTLIGDYRNGNVYAFDLDESLDNGEQRKWVRSWRALKEPQITTTRFSSLQIDMQTGIDVPAGTNPQCALRWSDDAHNWSNPIIEGAGKTGETARRVMFKRLGSTRRNSGLDRIFELSSTDVFGVALIGAVLQ